MNAKSPTPETLQEAIKFFADYSNAHAFMVQIRWPGGQVCCPTCGSARVRYIQTRRQWECREEHAKGRFSLKTGTIMEESPLPLETWLAALWMEVNSKNSISSHEVGRALGVTQKTGWFLLHRIRFALKEGWLTKLGNDAAVEADETMVGGLAANMHKHVRERKVGHSRGGAHMTNVMGLLERHSGKKHSTVRAKVIPNRQKETLHAIVKANVEPGSKLYTDALKNYRELADVFQHEFVDHAEAYVRGLVHTNGLENFWSLFKRCIKGTHVSVEPFHLEAYVDSEAFRFNNRETNDQGRFLGAANTISGKRITYKELINSGMEGLTATN